MTKSTTTEHVFTLKWIMQDDKLVRFEENSEAYVISDKVAEFDFEKAGVAKGTKVNVKIEKNAEHPEGYVVFMTKDKGQPISTTVSKEESRTESSSSTTNIKELTVNGLAVKTRGIIFAEQDNVWYTLAQDIDIDGLYDKGVRKGAKVKITVIPPEGRSKNEIITKIEVVEEAKKQWSNKKNFKNDYDSPEKQRSIEAQANVKAASWIVAAMVTPNTDPDTVLKMIRKIAEHNAILTNELKNKE